jgi:hypothetical protein
MFEPSRAVVIPDGHLHTASLPSNGNAAEL